VKHKNFAVHTVIDMQVSIWMAALFFVTEDNQGPSRLAPNSLDADHPGADGLLIGKCNRCRRKSYVASGRLSIMAFQIWRE
jgi:hypothetical protein